jgi:hypothetical protein
MEVTAEVALDRSRKRASTVGKGTKAASASKAGFLLWALAAEEVGPKVEASLGSNRCSSSSLSLVPSATAASFAMRTVS